MINRGVTKTSQYFFNTKNGMLEKIEENAQTIDSLSNQSITNLDDLTNEAAQEGMKEPLNNITVTTSEDNLIHNYFVSMEISWDASNCLSSAIIKAPKMNTENTNYWITYTGQLTIYAGYNFTFDYVNQNSHATENDAAKSLTKYWDNSKIAPFFKGEISRVKEMENDIIIYVDGIGRRFQQKIPDKFRQSFIYNQNVRDTFQAICEFLGITYICPPKIAADNGETEEEIKTTTDGTENDVNTRQQIESNIQNTVKNKVNNQTQSNNITNLNDPNSTVENMILTNNEEIDIQQNGYEDINFDANGVIIHGSTVIETSPDMAKTLLSMEEHPLEKYLEDETGIVEKVKKFLDGEMFDELHNKVMDYGSITIEPKSTSTSSISTTKNNNTLSSQGATNSNEVNENTEVINIPFDNYKSPYLLNLKINKEKNQLIPNNR